MSVLIDTSVWSLALRRKAVQLSVAEHRVVEEWRALISDGRARLAGIIRQEVLSGVRESRDFERLRAHLAPFDDAPADTAAHELAAKYFNTCRARGITPTAFDVLICALAARHGFAVFTTDADFSRYARILPVRLHSVGVTTR